MKPVFLFDIDGTLVRGTGPYHGNALVEAIRQILDVDATIEGIPVHGMLDRDILAEMMTAAGVDADRAAAAIPALVQRAQELYPITCPDLRAKVLPGVVEVLEEVIGLEYPVGLVTGNLSNIGWTKLERAGIRHYFSFGAFAEMGRTRADLARMAWGLAEGARQGVVTLIGDSPSDVEAAQANGFRMVAVATGMTSADTLASLGADVVLTDLSRPEARARLIHG